ncbi:NAD(P)-dependent oxidoreductase [soil metagenome]
MKKQILITGSGGFIGRNLVEMLADKYTILAPRSAELNLLDAQSVEDYLKIHQVDQIIHAAVYHVTRNSTLDPQKSLSINLRMFFNLARCNSLYKRMFHLGSGAEYGKQNPIKMVKETDFGDRIPTDDYGFFKYVITKTLPSYPNIFNLRLFGIFGKYEDWQIRFISNAICKAIFDIPITIKQNVYFDYLYIDDFVRIIMQLLEMEIIPYQIINVASGKRIDLKTIARMAQKFSNKKEVITIAKAGLSNEYTADNSLMSKLLPELLITPIEESIEVLYNWYKTHRNEIDVKKLSIDP